MRKHAWLMFLAAVVVVLLLVYTMTFIVDYTQMAVVKTFGQAGEPIYGQTNAGLHFKWPWPVAELVRYDARESVFDDTHDQIQTKDKQNVLMTVVCVWRIADINTVLTRQIEDMKDAEETVRGIVRDVKSQVVGEHTLGEFVNVDARRMKMGSIEAEILARARTNARKWGIHIETVRIKALGLPPKVTEKVIANMKEERNRYAQSYSALGQAVYEAIISRARAARDQILEFAKARARLIRAEGQQAAAEWLRKLEADPEFAAFLIRLDTMKETFKENSVFLLDPSVEVGYGYFRGGPGALSSRAPTTRPARKAGGTGKEVRP